MFYHLFYPLAQELSGLNVFRYISFRSVTAFLLAAFFSIVLGKIFIKWMIKKQFGQVVRDDGPQTHLKKAGTPTMGGLFIIASIMIAMVVCGNFSSVPVLGTLFITLSYFILGHIDDWAKIKKKNSDGVSAKGKLLWQFLSAALMSWAMVRLGAIDTTLHLPFIKGPVCDLGIVGQVLFSSLVIVGSSNAVNLTDGLDGLAIGPIITACGTFGLLAYLAGHREFAQYLYIPYVYGSGELTVLASAIIGAGVGFLWYNSYPAQVFMGDVGSLSLGGALGSMAVLTKNEFLFVIFGGIFVAEALSVIIQVGSYKLRKKRVFKMAPLHHHFELLGWPETKVIVRFWIVGLFLAIVAVAALKLR